MAWSYVCEMDNKTITADTKEQLVDKVVQHARDMHDMTMTREQAEESVNRNARQAA